MFHAQIIDCIKQAKNSKQGFFSQNTLMSNDPEEGFISAGKCVSWFCVCFFKENAKFKYAGSQLFAQETINLSTNDNPTMKDDNCFIPIN